MAKVTKVILRQKTEDGDFINLFPRTAGDQVAGEVAKSKSVGPLDEDQVMPKYHNELLELQKSDNTRQGMILNKLIIERDDDGITDIQVSAGQIYATGKIFAENGKEVVTKVALQDYLTSIQNNIYTTVVEESECTGRLKNTIKINGVEFNGTKSINIPVYTVSSAAPSNTNLLWINSNDGTINYHHAGAWHPCTGAWG